MNFIKNLPWKGYVISSIIVSFLSLLIYSKQNRVKDISEFLMWQPLIWGLVFILMIFFVWFLNKKEG